MGGMKVYTEIQQTEEISFREGKSLKIDYQHDCSGAIMLQVHRFPAPIPVSYSKTEYSITLLDIFTCGNKERVKFADLLPSQS